MDAHAAVTFSALVLCAPVNARSRDRYGTRDEGGERRGYVRVEIRPKQLAPDLRVTEPVQMRDASSSTLVSCVVEHGKPGPLKA